jgi:hypothetical protein
MMTQEELYLAEQDYQRYQMLINTKEVLTQEEYEFCKEWDAEEAKNLFHNTWNNTYLNLNVYSEVEHQERQFRMETGL